MHVLKLLVFSDSHGQIKAMKAAAEAERPDMILHLGDYVRDHEALQRLYPQCPMEHVAGNCDYPILGENRLLELEGVKIFMTHGHRYRVKQSMLYAVYAAREEHADLLLFGHTHCPVILQEPELVCMNPGAALDGSYGIVTLEQGLFHCELKNLK